MLLFWRIQYLDTRDKQFKDRDLSLDTDTLDTVTKAAVEATHDLDQSGRGRKMLRYRRLFKETEFSELDLNALCARHGGMAFVLLSDYFEDENGDEMTMKRMGVIVTGDPNAIMFPPGAKQHHIEYVLAQKDPIAYDGISLPRHDLLVLGYFTRDLRELLASAFFRDGPGTLTGSSGRDPILQTAITDEEIRSFVTIFRRLYMEKERANFLKAAEVFANAADGHPLANFVRGAAIEYEDGLERPPMMVPFLQGTCPFKRKRLIDVFLYTRYAHQPRENNTRQYQECLSAVGGRTSVLTWLFLTELWDCALQIRAGGCVVAKFYDRYCEVNRVSCDILDSMAKENAGIGTLETRQAREARILREKIEELAYALWQSKGRPEGGPTQFFREASKALRTAMDGVAPQDE